MNGMFKDIEPRWLTLAALIVLLLLLCNDMAAWASDSAESRCEENADDFRRVAYWVIMAGVLTAPIGIGVTILPIGGVLWMIAEFWWAIC